MGPKSLLRHPLVISPMKDMEPGTRFLPLIDERAPESIKPPQEIDRVLLCSGKVYYELFKWRQDKGIDNIAIVTLEQIAPFPFNLIQDLSRKYQRPSSCGCRRSRRTWAPGPSSSPASRR